MAEGTENEDPSGGVVSNRTMNMVVALALMAVAAVVMIVQLPARRRLGQGRRAGFRLFPVLCRAVHVRRQRRHFGPAPACARADGEGSFIAHGELMMVLQVLIPMTIFVVLSIYIGIYISMVLFIGFFMIWHGRYPLYKTMPVALAVPIVLFVIFEIWFLVPLPKGPFEAWLGY